MTITLKRLKAGSYETADRKFAVYSYEASDGTGTWWEIQTLDSDGYCAEFVDCVGTLARAREVLTRCYARPDLYPVN